MTGSPPSSPPSPPLPADPIHAGSREHYLDALLYDYEYRRRRADVDFYRRFALASTPPPGPVLDLACGSARLAIPLARAGYQVLGLDRSAPMLHRATERIARQGRAVRARISLACADMRRFALGRRFPLIIAAFNSFEHLYTRADLEACLACVRAHLEPGGLLVFDVQVPDLAWLTRDPRKRWARTRFTHPADGRGYIYTTNHEYDEIEQIVLIRLYYQPLEPADAEEHVVLLSQRKFFPAELEALVHANHFDVVERYGDFDFEPLDNHCESQVLVCQPRP